MKSFLWFYNEILWDVYSLAWMLLFQFLLWVSVSVLTLLFSNETYCMIWELQEEWVADGAIPYQPPSSLQSPFDASHELLYKVKSFQGLHFWVSSCWQAKQVLWTPFLGDIKQRFQLLLSIWKVSCFHPSPPWSNWQGNKSDQGDTWWKSWLRKRDHSEK